MVFLSLATASTAANVPKDAPKRLVFYGQDLEALRDFSASRCCGPIEGATAYVNLYGLLSADRNFGGLGLNRDLQPIADERGWGAGPVSAWKTAEEFDAPRLAIGLSLSESDQADGLRKIAAGEFDAEIRQLARFIIKLDRPVFLRIGYEFDGVWNSGYGDAPRYIAAWRHIVDIIRAAGAEKALFVWQSSASPIDDLIEARHEDVAAWYPGDSYVDWVALSWFLRPDELPAIETSYRPPTARALADEVVAFARLHRKPVMVAELAPQGYDIARGSHCHISPVWDGKSGEGCRRVSADRIWAEWFAPFFAYAASNADVIRAIAYIGVNWDRQPMWGPPYANGYWGDTRLQADPKIARRWNAAIARWRRLAL